MPPSGSSNNPQTLHQTNSNTSAPLPLSHSSNAASKNQSNSSQKKSSKPNRTKPDGSSYVAKKKKSKKKSSTHGHPETSSTQLRSTSSHNQSSTTSVAAHVLDQALENSLRNQRQKNRRRSDVYAQSHQRKETDYGKEDNFNQSKLVSSSKDTSNELSKKTQRKQHKHRKATYSSSSTGTAVDSKRAILKGSHSQAKSDHFSLSSINEEKDNASLQSSNSAKSALASSSTRRKHNRSRNKANTSGDSSSTYSTKVNDLRTVNQIHIEGVQGSRSSGFNANKSKDGHVRRKKYHYVNKMSKAGTKQSNENISQELPHRSPVLSSSSTDHINNANTKDDARQQPRRSRFFQKKETHRGMGQKRKKMLRGNSEDAQINQNAGPQHTQSEPPKQNLGQKSQNTKDNRKRNNPQSLQVEESDIESVTRTDQSTGSKQEDTPEAHEPKLELSKESDEQSDQGNTCEERPTVNGLETALEELRIQEESNGNQMLSKAENVSEGLPTSRIKRSDSNHSTLSSMENNTTITMTTTATDMTASLGDNNRPARMMMPPTFHGNYNRGNYDEFYPYQQESYPNPQSTCMLPPNPTFNDHSMIPFGIQMSYPVPYQYPMNGPIPFIPPHEYNNFAPNQDPNNYGPTPTDDRNDIMMPSSNQMSENSTDASYRVPFYPNESEPQQFPPCYNQQIQENSDIGIQNLQNKEVIGNRGEPGFRNPSANVIPNLSHNVPMLPPQLPFSGGMHPHFFGMNYQPPPQHMFMEQLLNYPPNTGMPHIMPSYPQNLVPDSFAENKEEIIEEKKALNADGACLDNQNSCSKQ